MEADNKLVGLFIGIWADSIRGRMDSGSQSIRESREAAAKRFSEIEGTLREGEKIKAILELKAGYEETSLVAPYSGPRPVLGYRPVDDPDPRMFAVLTVECALRRLQKWHQALAEHSWVMRRGDRCFNFRAEKGEMNPVPRGGNAKVDWCKNSRHRIIRPAIKSAIETRDIETIVEQTLADVGLLV